MYTSSHQLPDKGKLTCPECNGNMFLVSYGKVTCRDCLWTAKGSAGNKYGAKKTVAKDGIKRDSRYEASIADELLLRKKTGDIKDYESQFKVEMWAYDQNGLKAMKVTHKVDFRILHNDGSYELLEAKGAETSDYKMRRKWLETFWLPFNKDHVYTIIKQRK